MSGPGPSAQDAEGDLYDSYLDGALAGASEDPVAFLARHPGVSPEVRARIEALHRISARDRAARPRPAVRREPEPGLPHARLGEFRLLRRIGAGGMGIVYEAEQESLGRLAAVKILRPDLMVSPEARERFRREAQAVSRLRHPSIVSVLAAGEEDGARWIALDLVQGRGLDEVIRDAGKEGGGIAPARAARWIARIARALEYAHERGVIHRDIKPSNIIVGPGDEPSLVDFGVAREEGGGPTLTGPFVGSVPWAAPEQLAGRAVDGRVDVYGLGATLYECLTGRPPFAGGSVERVIHRALHEDPVPPGRIRSGVPRDLDSVVLKALEKDPGRRYEGAGALAADLEAVLDLRPVRARAPGTLRLVRAWARLHPALAAGAATAAAAAAVLIGYAVALEAGARERVRKDAAAEVELAGARLGAFRAQRDAAEDLEKEMVYERDAMETSWSTPEADAEYDRKDQRLQRLRQEREGAFHEVLDHLRRAETLDPGVAGVEGVRGSLYLEKWRDAIASRDEAAAESYRSLVAAHDPDGALARANFGKGTVSFSADAPGAEVHLFRYREESEIRSGGERRSVPVPLRTPPIPPGTFALRATRAAGDLRPGDLVVRFAGGPASGGAWIRKGGGGLARGDRIVSVDGAPVADLWELAEVLRAAPSGGPAKEREFLVARGERTLTVRAASPSALGAEAADLLPLAEEGGLPARVLAGGVLRDVVLPAGLLLRPTAAPAPLGPWSLAGPLPLGGMALEPGGWLAVFRAPGREDQRSVFTVESGQSLGVKVTMAPEGSTPAGFVRVLLEHGEPVRMLDREVICSEWLEFLNDPATLARLPGPGSPPRYVPRNRGPDAAGHWNRGADGRFTMADDWTPDWPILGVSYEDAIDYAAWRTARDRPLGGRGTYGLPRLDEWTVGGGSPLRLWVCGSRMRPKWTKSCYARRRATPEPVLRYPRDESPWGLLDMAGSVAEWCDDLYDERQGFRRIAGGSWAWAKMDQFKIWGGQGWSPRLVGDEAGFRLVLREEVR